ncbi:hypothetical protein ALC53_13790 [Atta colombica]|uniref:Uncharacterized protein n=1 Tax=Atta colombica TaxID=520822 RepID=A0A195AUJ2_9HYME|nr:hypothetical protein ALC53_13790 [Atta colombica]
MKFRNEGYFRRPTAAAGCRIFPFPPLTTCDERSGAIEKIRNDTDMKEKRKILSTKKWNRLQRKLIKDVRKINRLM